jgi:hypothetical protein
MTTQPAILDNCRMLKRAVQRALQAGKVSQCTLRASIDVRDISGRVRGFDNDADGARHNDAQHRMKNRRNLLLNVQCRDATETGPKPSSEKALRPLFNLQNYYRGHGSCHEG